MPQMRAARPGLPLSRMREQRKGVSVIESTSESEIVNITVTPKAKKSLPITPLMKATGEKTAIVVSAPPMTEKETSLAPSRAAS
ncbi:hypothetical protein SDC9_150964 [bioreactor metagenome]|uniref:Uncharacterized protein n=1 Tax=bioreactor metagenome TaxID=1076179 RepID=A0A645ER53_9ZZZZ